MFRDYRIWNSARLNEAERDALTWVAKRWRGQGGASRDEALFNMVRKGWPPEEASAWIYRAEHEHPTLLVRGEGTVLVPTLAALIALVTHTIAPFREDLDNLEAVVQHLHDRFDPKRQEVSRNALRDELGYDDAQLSRTLQLAGLPTGEVIHHGIEPLYWTSFEAFLDRRLPPARPRVADVPTLPITATVEQVEWMGLGPYRAPTTLRMSPMTVLVGANGVGKTTALLALRLLRDVARGGSQALAALGDRIAADATELMIALTTTLTRPGAPTTETLTWQLIADLGTSRPGLRESLRRVGPVPIDPPTAELATFDSGTGRWRDERGRLVEHTMTPGELALTTADFPPARWQLMALRQSSSRWRIIAGLVRPPRAATAATDQVTLPPVYRDDTDAFEQLRRHARAVTGVRDLRVGEHGELRIEDAHGVTLDARVMATGIVRAVEILAIILAPDPPPLFAIDEIENYFHANLAARLLDAMRSVSHRTRIVVTTHSGRILRHFDRSEVRVIRRDVRGSSLAALDDDPLLRRLTDVGELGDMIDDGYFASGA